MSFKSYVFAFSVGLLFSGGVAAQESISLFDGKTLNGWFVHGKEPWRAENGVLISGSPDKYLDAYEGSFLVSEGSYQNFELTLKVRLTGTEGFINSGVQVRSVSDPDSHHLIGYQVDVGDGWWGKLYDEGRRSEIIAVSADMEAVQAAVKSRGWNEYRILCEGRRIRSWINGVPALDFTEEDLKIPQNGHIALQIHDAGKVQVEFKDIQITTVPETTGLPGWQAIR